MHSRLLAHAVWVLVAAQTLIACGGAGPIPVQNATVTSEPTVFNATTAGQGTSTWNESTAAVPVSSADPTWGDRDALVTLVLFSDFQCPFCGKLESTVRDLKTAYGPYNLRIVWKNEPLPFHPHAKPAAEAGMGVLALAGHEAFWRFHDFAFEGQRDLNTENYKAWAEKSGVRDMATFRAGLEDHRWADKVLGDHALAAKLGVRGTPASYINGVSLTGAHPTDAFKKVIDEELVKARAQVAAGTPRDAVYVAMSQKNYAAGPIAEQEDAPEPTTLYKVPVGTSPVRGDSGKALVTIVEFSEFQCPYCQKVEPTLDKIRATYGDKVRIVWKNMPLPFHSRAVPAAMLAMRSRKQNGDAGFWRAHDQLFETQRQLEDSDLTKLAASLLLRPAAPVDAASVEGKGYLAQIKTDQALAAKLGANGTPTFFVNGHKLTGAQPLESFVKMVDEELKRAEAMAAAGIAQNKLYDALTSIGVQEDKGKPAMPSKVLAPTLDPPKKGDAPAEPKGAPSLGAPNAPVTLQVFSDYQCPFCMRLEETLAKVRKTYGNNVRIVWRDSPLPFHKDAAPAAEAAREVLRQKGQAAYWKFHDALFTAPSDLGTASLNAQAKKLGCDMAPFAEALATHVHERAVAFDVDAAKAAGINGTPHTFVNDYEVPGAQSFEAFKGAIDIALKDKSYKRKPLLLPAPASAPPPAPVAIAQVAIPTTSLLPMGLTASDLVVGTGQEARSGDQLRVHYIGTLKDGTKFDASRDHGAGGFGFILGQGMVIKGWDMGIVGMRVGGKRKLTIPAELGYGAQGAGGVIPPNATLVFEVELLAVESPLKAGLGNGAP